MVVRLLLRNTITHLIMGGLPVRADMPVEEVSVVMINTEVILVGAEDTTSKMDT